MLTSDLYTELQWLQKNGFLFEFTRDPERLRDYYDLRRRSYLNDKYMKGHFNKGEVDSYDLVSNFILVWYKNACVGGARLTTSTRDTRQILPSEDQAFQYSEQLPFLELANKNYGEIHRLVVAPGYRNLKISSKLLWFLYLKAVEQKLDYLFSPSTHIRSRMHRLLFSQIGTSIKIHSDICICSKKYDFVDMNIISMNVREQPVYDFAKERICEGLSSNLYSGNKLTTRT